MPSIDQVIAEIETACRRFPFILEVIREDETRHTVKYALMLARDFYVQIYVNVRNDTTGMALIYHGQRLYGRDSIKGRWHRHPFEAPDEHDTSPEGAQAVTFEEFLREVQEIIEREELL